MRVGVNWVLFIYMCVCVGSLNCNYCNYCVLRPVLNYIRDTIGQGLCSSLCLYIDSIYDGLPYSCF